jgi:tetratricopeptide (TPR) repeat protein
MSRLIVLALALLVAGRASAQTPLELCQSRATGHDDRIAACTAVIESRPDDRALAMALCSRAFGLTEKRELDRAMADLDEAIRLHPTYPCSFNNRGRVWAFKGDLKRAIADYDTAIKLDPNFVIAYSNRGRAYLDRRQFDQAGTAIEDFTAQARLTPDDMMIFINRGNVWRSLKELDKAAADYAEVIRLAPTDARGWRGLVRPMQGDFDGGLADHNRAIEYDPNDAYSWNNRGIARREKGDRDGAIADFRKALQINPNLPTARAILREMGVTP